MGLQTWGGLPKSASDSETIEEAIDRLIGTHESDASAHLGAGESLQAHKNDSVIDHPAESVVADKLSSSDTFLFLPVVPPDTGDIDNCTYYNNAPWLNLNQNNTFSDEGSYFITSFIPSDLGYSSGDVVFDFMLFGSGTSGTWQHELTFSFGKIQIKNGYYRIGYYSSGWQYSDWIAQSVGVPLRFRFSYTASDETLRVFLRSVQVYSHSHTFSLDSGEFNVMGIIDRNSSSSASFWFGNLLIYFEGI